LYTSAPRLREWLASKKLDTSVQLYGFNFSDRAPSGNQLPAFL